MAPGRITLQEAADRLGVHYMTAYRYVRTGRLAARRDGVQWVVDPAEVARLRSAPRPARGRVRAEGPDKLAARLVAGDEAGAWTVVEAALTSGVEPADHYQDILVPALRSVGDGWEEGTLAVGDEHRATAGCPGSHTSRVARWVHGWPLKRAPTSRPYSGHS